MALSHQQQVASNGDWSSAGYTSPWNALLDIAHAYLRQGATFTCFASATLKAGLAAAGSKERNHNRGARQQRRAWEAARTYTGGASGATTVTSEDLALWRATMDTLVLPNPRTRATDYRILRTLTARAEVAHQTSNLNGAVRLLAEETLLTKETVTRSLRRLAVAGLIERTYQEAGQATLITLIPDAAISAVAIAASGTYTSPAHTTRETDEAWARRGFNRYHEFAYAAVAGGTAETVRDIATNLGCSRSTAYKTLRVLVDAGLLTATSAPGLSTTYSLGERDIDALATDPNLPGVPTAGRREAMRRTHAHERDHYLDVLEDAKQLQSTGKRPAGLPMEWEASPQEVEVLMATHFATDVDPWGMPVDADDALVEPDVPDTEPVLPDVDLGALLAWLAGDGGAAPTAPTATEVVPDGVRPVITADVIRSGIPVDQLLTDYEPAPQPCREALAAYREIHGLDILDPASTAPAIKLGILAPPIGASA